MPNKREPEVWEEALQDRELRAGRRPHNCMPSGQDRDTLRCSVARCRKDAEITVQGEGAFCDLHNEERLERKLRQARKDLGL